MTALEKWKKLHPRHSELLIRALGEYFGFNGPFASFACPSCKVTLELTVSRKSHINHRQSRTGRLRSKAPAQVRGELYDLIVKLARARKRRTGDINAEFKRSLGRRANRMNPAKLRELKIDWLKSQLRTIRA